MEPSWDWSIRKILYSLVHFYAEKRSCRSCNSPSSLFPLERHHDLGPQGPAVVAVFDFQVSIGVPGL